MVDHLSDINASYMCKIRERTSLQGLGWKQTSARERVVQGYLATGAYVKFHSYLLSLCLWGLNRSHPHARCKFCIYLG